MELRVKRAPRIEAEITVPGDKSISHRAAIIAALPPLILALTIQRYLVRGLSFGAVKA